MTEHVEQPAAGINWVIGEVIGAVTALELATVAVQPRARVIPVETKPVPFPASRRLGG